MIATPESGLINAGSASFDLTTAAQLDITWLHHDALPERADAALQAAVRAIEFPAGNGRIYVGCEAASMRRICFRIVASTPR